MAIKYARKFFGALIWSLFNRKRSKKIERFREIQRDSEKIHQSRELKKINK